MHSPPGCKESWTGGTPSKSWTAVQLCHIGCFVMRAVPNSWKPEQRQWDTLLRGKSPRSLRFFGLQERHSINRFTEESSPRAEARCSGVQGSLSPQHALRVPRNPFFQSTTAAGPPKQEQPNENPVEVHFQDTTANNVLEQSCKSCSRSGPVEYEKVSSVGREGSVK